MSSRRLAVVLTVIAAMLVPAAVAWACNPQPDVGTDQMSYTPGEQMTVSGRYFKANEAITITTDPSGPTRDTRSTSAGTLREGFNAPRDPGSYVLTASHPGGAPARTTFRVTDPSSTEPPPRMEFIRPSIERSPAGVTTVPRQPTGGSGGPQPDPRPAPRPQQAGGGSGEPTTIFFQPGPAPARTTGGGSAGGGFGGGGGFDGGGSAGGGGSGGGDSGAGGAASGTENGVIRVPAGRNVFLDSLAPADRRAGGAGRATTTAADAGRGPSERAATGDLWGGFRSGKAPSLLDAGGSADDSGPGATIGLALLGLGLAGLLAALAVAEARRRRALAG